VQFSIKPTPIVQFSIKVPQSGGDTGDVPSPVFPSSDMSELSGFDEDDFLDRSFSDHHDHSSGGAQQVRVNTNLVSKAKQQQFQQQFSARKPAVNGGDL
jgi:hypothetical protein